ncbi:hypothetical protein [Tuberibacillus sp. Marseille-P3662]|uniref:hypothetical protein n=1 Tax=Tuberibacillus sp. Marseille-P3662 TaxID=1965358 RepID=UPI000A1CEBD9|nr:hypothetical protein [Tuberibacillus sp. Marseille-P3662]
MKEHERQAIINHYHACASCRHFGHDDRQGKQVPICRRLGYDTQPDWQFNCWDPKPRVKQAIHKKMGW